MNTQRRVVLEKSRDGLQDIFKVQENVQMDIPQSHEVIIKIKACVLNKIDTEILQEFKIIDKQTVPLGTEVSGIVTQVGLDVSRVDVGDEVVGVLPPDSRSGGCAMFCCISEYNLVKKPSKVNFADAACCVGDGIKAYTALYYKANICGGETVLVMNGATGTGIIAIQLAQSWGAKVITTANSEEEMIFLESFQPEIGKIIDYRKPNISLFNISLEETGGAGVDCIIDNGVQQYSEEFSGDSDACNRIPSKHDIIMCLAVGGTWITSQQDLQLDPPNSKILYLKGASISFLFKDAWTLSRGQQGRYLHILTDVLEKVENGAIKPMVHHTVSFDDACTTLDNLHQFTVGNVVLVM